MAKTYGRRDSQRSRVYAAERKVNEFVSGKNVGSMLGVWTFLEKVQRDKWFRRHFGYHRFRVSDGRGTRIARGGGDWLNLPRWSRTPMIMLHEVAHCCSHTGAVHGWNFCAVYLKLVRHFLGVGVHARLRAEFKAHRVRYTRPRRLTPEQREACRLRLAANVGRFHSPERS